MIEYLYLFQDFGNMALRAALGFAFIAHGYPKLFRNFSGTAGWFDSIGLRPGRFWAAVSGSAEFFGGIAVLVGFFTQIAAALIAVNMLVALVKVKWGKSNFVTDQNAAGWELEFAYLLIALALVFFGAGGWSLDHILKWRF